MAENTLELTLRPVAKRSYTTDARFYSALSATQRTTLAADVPVVFDVGLDAGLGDRQIFGLVVGLGFGLLFGLGGGLVGGGGAAIQLHPPLPPLPRRLSPLPRTHPLARPLL